MNRDKIIGAVMAIVGLAVGALIVLALWGMPG